MTKAQVNVRLSAECQALLEAAADTYGGKSQAIEAALKQLANPPAAGAAPPPGVSTNDKPAIDLPAALEQAAKRLRSLEKLARFAKIDAF